MLIVALLAVGVSLIVPPRYTAVAQVLPPPEDDVLGVSSLLSGGTGSKLKRLATAGMVGGSPSDLMAGILRSRAIMEQVVAQCSVAQRYRVRRRSVELAIRQLGKMTRLSVSDEGILDIRVEAKRRQWAADIANCYVAQLDTFLRTSNMSRGRNTRVFLERHIDELDAALDSARVSLVAFQKAHRVVSVDEESKAAVDEYARLRAELLVKQSELGVLEQFTGPENPYTRRVAGEVSSFRSELSSLESGESLGGFGVGFGVSLKNLPEVSMEFWRKYRDVKVLEEAYALVFQQLEYARVLEARDTPTISVLSWAVPPERRSYPKRVVMVLLAAAFAFLMSAGAALVADHMRQLRVNRPVEYQSWAGLWSEARALGAEVRSLFRRSR
jgi:uncharacterized protein involved in exopolysaccharide biosynthesis